MSMYESLLKHKCDILRHTSTQNPLTGEVTESWNPIITDLPCLIQPLTGKQAIEAQGLELVSTYKGFFKYNDDIQLRDKIVFESRTYLITYILKGWEGGSHHKEVLLDIERGTDAL